MSTVRKMACSLVGIVICTALLSGCSDEKEVKPAQKIESAQTQIAKDAAQEIKKPIEAAKNARSQAEAQGKKKLEGC